MRIIISKDGPVRVDSDESDGTITITENTVTIYLEIS